MRNFLNYHPHKHVAIIIDMDGGHYFITINPRRKDSAKKRGRRILTLLLLVHRGPLKIR